MEFTRASASRWHPFSLADFPISNSGPGPSPVCPLCRLSGSSQAFRAASSLREVPNGELWLHPASDDPLRLNKTGHSALTHSFVLAPTRAFAQLIVMVGAHTRTDTEWSSKSVQSTFRVINGNPGNPSSMNRCPQLRASPGKDQAPLLNTTPLV